MNTAIEIDASYEVYEWEALVNSLREELQEYGALLNLLNEQLECIIVQDSEKILELNDSIGEQLESNNRVREEREHLIEEIAHTAGYEDTPSLRRMLHLFPQTAQGLISALIEEVFSAIGKIQYKARQNQMLLMRITQLTEELLQKIFPVEKTSTYSPTGAVKFAAPAVSSCLNVSA